MEIQFEKERAMKAVPPSKTTKTKARRNKVVNKFIGVRQRPSGRWVAEIKDTTQKIRMWLGTFESAEAAARAYDEAACLLRGSNTRTNFHVTQLSSNSPLASRITNLLNNKKNINTAAADDAKPPKQQQQQQESSSESSSSTSDDCLLFDDVYKPDLGGVDDHDAAWGDHNNSSSSSFSFWAQEMMLELPHRNTRSSDKEEEELSEFERMKVERQISASLYAINGLHQYMETVSSVYDPSDSDAAFWDLPPLCPLLT